MNNSRAICWDSSWALPPIGPNQKGIFLMLSVPARRLWVDPFVHSPRKSLLLKLTGIGDALLSRRGVWKFQEVVSNPFMLDLACPAPKPTTRWHWKFLLKAFPTKVASGKCTADPLYARVLINFKGNSIIGLSTPGSWHSWGGGRKEEGDKRVASHCI